jgi:flagellar FliL protein
LQAPCYHLLMEKVQKILILLNLLVAFAGVGIVYYSHNIIKPPPTDQNAEAENLQLMALEKTQVKPFALKKFVVNLHSKGTRLRYLDVEMNILPFHADQTELVKSHEHLIKDILIEISSHLVPEELDTLSGKILLENKIKKQVNSKLGQPVIKQIYFSGFIIQ